MIRRIYSSDPAFKTLRFRPGFNVIIADRAPNATELQSRNGAGKSSFLRLVHFLLGGSCKRGECIFLDSALRDATFGMEFDLGGGTVAVERSGARPSRVYFPHGTFDRWPHTPTRKGDETRPSLKLEEWKGVLGAVFFNLRGADDEQRAQKFIPTFRTLFSYFARLHEHGAFLDVSQIAAEQLLWSQQVAIAFLLGLDWKIPQGMQAIRTRQRVIRQLREVIEEHGGIEGLIPRSDDLAARLTLAKNDVSRVTASLESYRINPEYHRYEKDADSLTATIARTHDEDTFDREVIASIEQALASEIPPQPEDLIALYREASVELPAAVVKRFEDVRAFHESVLRNRESYLRGELQEARRRVAERAKVRAQADQRRSEVMAILRSSGALEQFTLLQTELGVLTGQMTALREQVRAAKEMEDAQLQLNIDTAALELRLGRNHLEQADRIEEAQLIFAEISRRLYEEPGRLTISRKLSGPPVKASIHGQESVGITHMQIYCFDIMLMRLALQQGFGPQFLIHDSHLFDGVDVRQVHHALSTAVEQSAGHRFQYIATMNSDWAATIERAGLDLAPYRVPVTLNDQQDGGLFGRRFG